MKNLANGTTALIFRYDHIPPLVNLKFLLTCSLLCEAYPVDPISNYSHTPVNICNPHYPALLFLYNINFWYIIQLTYLLCVSFFICLPVRKKITLRGLYFLFLFCFLVCPQHVEQCQAHSGLSIISCCVNKWIKQ